MPTPTSGWSLRSDRTFFDQAARRGSRFFTLYFLPYSGFEAVVVVPKTVAKLATNRNQIKRRLKAILNDIKKTSPHPTMKLVIVVRHPTTTASFTELKTQLLTTLSQL